MENVLTAFIVIFIIVFAVLTLSEAMINSQDMLQVSFQEMEARMEMQTRTNLVPVNDVEFRDTNLVSLTFRNTGSIRLTDFDQWDVIVQYFDNAQSANYHIDWLSYNSNIPLSNEWAIDGIYMNAVEGIEEMFEPEILNTGEELVLLLNISPQVGAGQAIHALVSVPNGIGVSTSVIRNVPPVLVANAGLTITHGETGVIDSAKLLTTDTDDAVQDLTYTILTVPSEGVLSPADRFTQADIGNGLLMFTSDVSGSYSFEFTVSDGKDIIGPFIFPITVVNEPVVLAANTGLTLGGSSPYIITSAMLNATDADDLASHLTYTVTTMPAHGTLNPGAVFAQEHINSGLLSYTYSGSGNDSFMFNISDGENVIGPFEFQISMPE